MKKLLMGAVVLFLFAASISIVEVSCQKTHASPLSPTSGTGNILYSTPAISNIVNSDTTYSALNLFICNLDGSNARQIPVALPSGLFIANSLNNNICLTSDADSVVFPVGQNNANGYQIVGIYICAIDGSGLKNVITSGIGTNFAALCDVK